MADYIVRATAAGDSIRIFAMTSTELVGEAAKRHNTTNVATAALGRLLTAGALMGSMQKNVSDVLTLQIACGGPIEGLTVTAGICDDGESIYVKGYANNPSVDLPLRPYLNGRQISEEMLKELPEGAEVRYKLDVGGALGPGILTVIRDMGLKEPFSGQTELVSGEIAEDLTYYFANSEQIPSSVALGVLCAPEGQVLCAGGFIIQLLPFASDEVITELEARLGSIRPITVMLSEGMSPEDIIGEIFDGMDLKINDKIPAAFRCNCSKERVSKAVMSIDISDIREMIDDDKDIEVGCHFCGEHYMFTTEDLKNILAEKLKLQ